MEIAQKSGQSVAMEQLAAFDSGRAVTRAATKLHSLLVINSGSSTIKFALFDAGAEQAKLFGGVLDRIGDSRSRFVVKTATGDIVADQQIKVDDHDIAFGVLADYAKTLAADRPIVAVGHRVAHGGADCDCPVLVTDEIEERLEQLVPLAPLHMPHNLAGISAMRKDYPKLPQVACFDTAFHRSLPRLAKLTGLPRQFQAAGIERYGFHGLSYESAVAALQKSGVVVERERIIIAHLGNGASMCALKNGRSLETTMGFSPLTGLLMGTRCGDLDPGAVLHLQTAMGMSPEAVQNLLYEQSGLLGISGISNDMRDLIAQPESAPAREAIELFCYRAKQHLGALTAVLGGLDRLVFTGGIGQNAPEIRERICDGLNHFGLALDVEANGAGLGLISRQGAAVIIQTIASDEESMIARHVQHLAVGQHSQVTP